MKEFNPDDYPTKAEALKAFIQETHDEGKEPRSIMPEEFDGVPVKASAYIDPSHVFLTNLGTDGPANGYRTLCGWHTTSEDWCHYEKAHLFARRYSSPFCKIS